MLPLAKGWTSPEGLFEHAEERAEFAEELTRDRHFCTYREICELLVELVMLDGDGVL